MTKKTETLASATADLKPVARAINLNLSQCSRALLKADDARLAAAIKISEAAAVCEERSVNFKKWCASALKSHSYETIRKLRPIGDAERAEEGAGARMLTEMREQNRIYNAEMRARKAAEASEGGEGGEGGETAPKQKDPEAAILNIFNSLDPVQQKALLAKLQAIVKAAKK